MTGRKSNYWDDKAINPVDDSKDYEYFSDLVWITRRIEYTRAKPPRWCVECRSPVVTGWWGPTCALCNKLFMEPLEHV